MSTENQIQQNTALIGVQAGSNHLAIVELGPVQTGLALSSPSIDEGGHIPLRYAADGDDMSPALAWGNVPAEAKEIVVICEDPDAPTPRPFVHWLLYALSPETTGIPEALDKGGEIDDPSALQGRTSDDELGYAGPLPPEGDGLHDYHFQIFALDEETGLPPGASREELLARMHGHVIAAGELIATYER